MARGRRRTTEDSKQRTDDERPRTEGGGPQFLTENRELSTGNSPRVPPGREKARADFLEAQRLEACRRCCQNCAYATRPKGKWFRILLAGFPGLLACLNHPDSPGEMTEVCYTGVCRNFRCKRRPPVRLEPPEPPNERVKYIALTRGKQALVDAEDYDRLKRHKWTASSSGPKCYAQRNEKGHSIMMHREIMHAPKGMVVDHIDGNGLNDCKSNLRICTQSQNNYNGRPRGGTSGFKGVSYDKERGTYKAYVWEKGRTVVLGRYASQMEAAQVRDLRAVQFNGEYAYLNFPAEWPKERIKEVYEKAQAERDRLASNRKGLGAASLRSAATKKDEKRRPLVYGRDW
jgi:hypothetical protein